VDKHKGPCAINYFNDTISNLFKIPIKVNIQVAIVHGGVGACGDSRYPDIYVRLDDPEIFNFIRSQISEEIDKDNEKLPTPSKVIFYVKSRLIFQLHLDVCI